MMRQTVVLIAFLSTQLARENGFRSVPDENASMEGSMPAAPVLLRIQGLGVTTEFTRSCLALILPWKIWLAKTFPVEHEPCKTLCGSTVSVRPETVSCNSRK